MLAGQSSRVCCPTMNLQPRPNSAVCVLTKQIIDYSIHVLLLKNGQRAESCPKFFSISGHNVDNGPRISRTPDLFSHTRSQHYILIYMTKDKSKYKFDPISQPIKIERKRLLRWVWRRDHQCECANKSGTLSDADSASNRVIKFCWRDEEMDNGGGGCW